MTQQTAVASEELGGSSEELMSQAHNLPEQVSFFNLSNEYQLQDIIQQQVWEIGRHRQHNSKQSSYQAKISFHGTDFERM